MLNLGFGTEFEFSFQLEGEISLQVLWRIAKSLFLVEIKFRLLCL
jgi:hypothetical protein